MSNIFGFVRSPTNKLYVLFLNYTVHLYDKVLCGLQSSEPKMLGLLRNFLVRFVKPSAMLSKLETEVDYHTGYNLKENKDIVIGEAAEDFLANKEKNHLREKRIMKFYSCVKKYFTAVIDYLKLNLPLSDSLLRHAEVADISLQSSSQISSLVYFLDRYPVLQEGTTRDWVAIGKIENENSTRTWLLWW